MQRNASGSFTMKNAINLLILLVLGACNMVFPGDGCNPASTAPHSEDVPRQCNTKCCEFVVYGESETCHEMWCHDKDCAWEMNHANCY